MTDEGAARLGKCHDFCPSWWRGPWREWHRGHGCDKDDGRPRSDAGWAELNAGRGLPPEYRPPQEAK